MLKLVMGAQALFLVFVVSGIAAGPSPLYSTVFIAPPSTAGLGTNGSDSDGVNCKRFTPAVTVPPGGPGFGCASFQKAYSLAQPGDTVYLNWSGAWQTAQRIGPSSNHSGPKGCNYPVDVSGCIDFTPSAGATPSLTPLSRGTQSPNLLICGDYVEISNLTFNQYTYVDQFNDTIADTTWGVGAGDNTCQPSGSPPHDVFVKNVVSNGPIGIVGGANNVYVLGGAVQNAINFPPQFGGPALVNGSYTDAVHNSTIDGVLFNNIAGNDSSHHHMDCMHMDYAGYSNTVRNSRFESCPGSFESIRIEAEGNPANHQDSQTNLLIENNFFDGQPLGFDCHDNGCTVTGNVVRFNTFVGGGFLPTSDCAQRPGTSCNVQNNTFYGNLVTRGCPGNSAIGGTGWTSAYDVWAGGGGPSTICADDKTSLYNRTVRLKAPGAPTYDDHVADCAQPGSALVPPTVAGGRPTKDQGGDLLPPKWLAGAGADQCDTSLMVLGKSIGAVHIGESEQDVIATYGRPRNQSTAVFGKQRLKRLLFRAHAALLWVFEDAQRQVVGIGTTSPYYENRAGLQVGTSPGMVLGWARTNWLDCRSAYYRSGPVGVFVALAGGKRGHKISAVSFVKSGNGYETCPAVKARPAKKR